MPGLLSRKSFEAFDASVDERHARAELRRQVARLERELAGLVGEAFGRIELDHRIVGVGGPPRLLDLGELEQLRDELAERIGAAQVAVHERTEVETSNRELLRRMLDAPAEFKWVRISRADVGEPGCGGWHSRPRLGPLGMLMGWWQVKVSSGCPLPGRLAAVEQEAQAAQPRRWATAAGKAGGGEGRGRGPGAETDAGSAA